MRLSDEEVSSENITLLDDVTEKTNANIDKQKIIRKTWICSICGYEHYGDEPPEKCPRCGQSGDVFKLQDGIF